MRESKHPWGSILILAACGVLLSGLPLKAQDAQHTIVRRIIEAKTSLHLQPDQVNKLQPLLQEDEQLRRDGQRLDSIRRQIQTLLSQEPSNVERLKTLTAEATGLEQQLHTRGSSLAERLRGILTGDQYNTLLKVEIDPERTPIALTQTYTPAGGWVFQTHLEINTDNGIDTHCETRDWEIRVPYCYVVDTSQGSQGGYTLNVTTAQGVREQTVTPIINDNIYDVGRAIHIRICSQPFWGAPGRWAADVTLFGTKLP